MYPVIFQKGFITIYSYGVMFALGCLVVVLLASYDNKRLNPSSQPPTPNIFDLAFGILLAAIAGARLFYFIEHFSYFKENLLEIIMIHKGGLVFYGGLIAGAFYFILYLKIKKINIYDMAYVFVPYLPLGHAFGRAGCFLNGCCGGKHGIPVQLYEAGGNVLICAILLFLRKRLGKHLFWAYVILYAVLRFFLEFLRGDEVVVLGPFRISQWVSVLVILLAGAMLLKPKKSRDSK